MLYNDTQVHVNIKHHRKYSVVFALFVQSKDCCFNCCFFFAYVSVCVLVYENELKNNKCFFLCLLISQTQLLLSLTLVSYVTDQPSVALEPSYSEYGIRYNVYSLKLLYRTSQLKDSSINCSKFQISINTYIKIISFVRCFRKITCPWPWRS